MACSNIIKLVPLERRDGPSVATWKGVSYLYRSDARNGVTEFYGRFLDRLSSQQGRPVLKKGEGAVEFNHGAVAFFYRFKIIPPEEAAKVRKALAKVGMHKVELDYFSRD